MGERPYFYVPDIATSLQLSEDEAKHAYRVLRLKPGDEINISDGKGHLYGAKLLGSSAKEPLITELTLLQVADDKLPKLEVAIAPTKNMDRIEWSLEKLTEIGVTHFTIVVTDRAVRCNVNLDRLERVMVAAMKQSEKLVAVNLMLYKSMADFLANMQYEGRYIGYCAEVGEKQRLKDVFKVGQDNSFLIGPEGDFTSDEVELAMQKGFVPVSLGDERLRTETAGLYVGMLHHILND